MTIKPDFLDWYVCEVEAAIAARPKKKMKETAEARAAAKAVPKEMLATGTYILANSRIHHVRCHCCGDEIAIGQMIHWHPNMRDSIRCLACGDYPQNLRENFTPFVASQPTVVRHALTPEQALAAKLRAMRIEFDAAEAARAVKARAAAAPPKEMTQAEIEAYWGLTAKEIRQAAPAVKRVWYGRQDAVD